MFWWQWWCQRQWPEQNKEIDMIFSGQWQSKDDNDEIYDDADDNLVFSGQLQSEV